MPITLPTQSFGPTISQNYSAAVQQGSQIYLQVTVPGVASGGSSVASGTSVVGGVIDPSVAPQPGSSITVGYVTSVAQSDDYGAQAFYGLGNIEPFEIQPLQFSGQLTISGGRLYNFSWLGQLFGSAGEILTSGALNIMIVNRAYNGGGNLTQAATTPEITYVGFVAQSYNVTYQANAYTLQSATGFYRTIIMGLPNVYTRNQ